MKQLAVDLNADVGESFGHYRIGNDEELFTSITSANIACGFHAGDPTTIRKTLELAAKYQVAVGAHPGYPDRLHFGRVALPFSPEEITDFILYQLGALQAMAQTSGLIVQHVKLHGALYQVAAEDHRLAETFLDAMVRLHQPLIIIGPPDCALQQEAEERGLDYAAEGFVDRGYNDDGKLVPRGKPNSMITDPEAAADQALRLTKEHFVQSVNGKRVERKISTLCIHGDTAGASEIARAVRERLEQAKIAVEPLHHLLA